MTKRNDTGWNAGDKAGLVSIGPYKLFLAGSGPTRKTGEPAVIVIPGLGDGGNGWGPVKRHVEKFARVYIYDRAGLGKSEPSRGSLPRTATVIAEELAMLLGAAKVAPPYVVVAHSYGGILAREFLALRNKDIAGMVLVDAEQERNRADLPWPHEAVPAIAAKLDYYNTIGLDKEHKLTAEEWEEEIANGERNKDVCEAEDEASKSSYGTLAKKRQTDLQVLGSRPLSVIKGDMGEDLRKFYTAAVKAKKDGMDIKDRHLAELKYSVEHIGDIDDKLQRGHLRLSSNSRYVHAAKGGHNLQATEPELIAKEIYWVLESAREKKKKQNMVVDVDGGPFPEEERWFFGRRL